MTAARPQMLRMLRDRDVLPALERALASAGVDGYRIEVGGKHPILVFDHNGTSRRLAFAGSPRNPWRAAKASVAQLRRILRGVSA